MQCLLPPSVTPKQAAIFVTALLQVVFGVVTLLCNKTIFSSLLKSQLVVEEGTKTFEAWKETPIPVYTKFYFFNMLNADDFQENHGKPILEERGPYTFREVEHKVNLVWHKDGTVSYHRKKFWYFEPEMSVGSLQDTVVTLNLPMVGAVDYARGSFMMEFGLSDMLSTIEATLFINKTVGELLFDGYDDPVLEIGSSFDEEEKKIPMEKFGWFYKRNGTTWSDGLLRMHTGKDDINKLGEIVSWNKSNRTEAFRGKCGQVTGSSDGLFAPGLLKKAESFDIWSTDTCRKLTFSREGKQMVHGIEVDRFKLSDTVFDNGSVCKDNLCYENNLPTGVQNVSQCKMKSPAFLSRPHFYLADNYYKDQFQIGIHPHPEDHESFFLIEPHTSIPLQVQMALQLNVLIEKSEGMEYVFKDLPTVFFPVLWFESSAGLPETMAGALLTLINIPTIMIVASIIGIIAGLIGMAAVYRCVTRSKTMSGSTEEKGVATVTKQDPNTGSISFFTKF